MEELEVIIGVRELLHLSISLHQLRDLLIQLFNEVAGLFRCGFMLPFDLFNKLSQISLNKL